ncbi:MAG: LamG domain-containing protein, partial [Planctomycetota bacterium]
MCAKLRWSCCFLTVVIFLTGAVSVEGADPTLVGWWKFEEASGTLYDQSDYGNNGTGNGVTYQQPGQDGYALGFDGVDDTMPFGGNGRPSDTFSFGGWFKTSSTHEIDGESTGGVGGTSGQRYAFDPAHGGDSNGGAGLSIGTNGISVYEHGSGYMPATAVYAVEIGDDWNHIMVVYDNKQPTIYLNGEAVHTGLVSPRAVVQAPVVLGGMAYGYFEGLMDEVRVYNRVLTQAEIAELAIVRRATGPNPADGSNAAPDYYEDNVYMVLDYVPGYGATTHTAYFSDNFDDVNDRSSEHSLGSVPPWPALSEHAFVVGYDDPGIPEYARPPLVGGKTYYWCIDEFDGTDTWPGKVWSFTVMPKQAWGPTPADGEELVPPGGTMTWNLGDQDPTGYSLSYHVYIGTDSSAVAGVATGDTASPVYAGTVDTESFDYSDLEAETEHFWRVDTVLTMIRPPFLPTITKGDVWSFTTGPKGIGGILREWWNDIGGTDAIADLKNDPNYPANPDGSEIVDLFEGPTNIADNYGSRLHGWLYVQNTGYYTFWIATDNEGELWLSTDMTPGNARLVSYIYGAWAGSRQFDDPDVTPSAPIHLEGGNMYYISGLMKEGAGGDNIAVAWEGPDSGGSREVIPGRYLKAYVPVMAENPHPAHRSRDADLDVTLSWDAGLDESTDSPYATQHVYVGSDPVAVANATTSSDEYMGGPSGPNEYGPLSLDYLENVYWRVDGVSAESGTVVYPGSVWTFRATYDLGSVCDPNLKLWLAFEDDVLDSSGYARDGTAYGGPTYTDGVEGQAILFDGIDDYVNIEVPTGISGDAPRTIAGWAKASTTAISDWATVFG